MGKQKTKPTESDNSAGSAGSELDQYREDPANTRRRGKRAKTALRKSLETFGAGRSIVVDADGDTIGGAGVLEQAKALGLRFREVESDGSELIVVKRTDLKKGDSRRTGLGIADNRTAELSEYDNDALRDAMRELEAVNADFEAVGFSDIDAGRILASGSFYGDEDRVESPQNDTRAKKGYMYRLGRHRLAVGSCLSADFVKAGLQAGFGTDGVAKLYLTDPPYGVNVGAKMDSLAKWENRSKNRDRSDVNNDELQGDALLEFLTDAFKAANEILAPGRSFYIWHPPGHESIYFEMAVEAVGLRKRQSLIWRKDQFVVGRSDYQVKHEPCIYGWKGGAKHVFVADRTHTTVIDWVRPRASRQHPVTKPVDLMEYLICNSSREGEIVFDGFTGSGSTLMAAEHAGRLCYAIEIDPKYADVIIGRYCAHTKTDPESIYDDEIEI